MRLLAVLVARFAMEGALAAQFFELLPGFGLCFVGDICDVRSRFSFASWNVCGP